MVNCKCDTFREERKGQHLGVYCSKCGRWIKWKKYVKAGNFIMPIGKYKGEQIKDIPKDYLNWIIDKKIKNISKKAEEYMGDEYGK